MGQKKIPKLPARDSLTSATERKIIFFVCVIAAVRVLIFCAAFPFFNNVDEQAHTDLVIKYAGGYLPTGLDPFSPQSARFFSLYSSPEYFLPPERLAEYLPQTWRLPGPERDRILEASSQQWQSRENHESGEPPLYYVLAGLWLDLIRAFGIQGGCLLYGVRFLNIAFVTALVWLGYIAGRNSFPDRPLIRMGLPALLAVWPQTTFYSVQSDALSPIFFGIAFIGLIKFLQTANPTPGVGVLTGLALAATCLTKASNLPLLGVAAVAIIFKTWQIMSGPGLKRCVSAFLALLVCTALPLAAWCFWNYHIFGDLTGSSAKIQLLDWTRKPLDAWWPHPIFTPSGLMEFWSNLIASFWRGEFIWHGQRMASSALDAFYWISSVAVTVLGVTIFFWRSAIKGNLARQSLGLALLSFAALVGFVALLSIAFDFGACPYPSREHPFFTSGRLLNAAAIPFFLVYACTLDWALRRVSNNNVQFLILTGIALFILISGAIMNWPAFASPYNFFHMCVGSG